MRTDGKHGGTLQEGEGDDALWRLLERAPQPGAVSPYFARRVLREVAALDATRSTAEGLSNWLVRVWLGWSRSPGTAFACALAVVTLLAAGGVGLSSMRPHPAVAPAVAFQPPPATLSETDPAPAVSSDAVEHDPVLSSALAVAPEPVVTAQDVEVIADLDNVLSREESRLWTEDDTARF